jgi:hypothetical protein
MPADVWDELRDAMADLEEATRPRSPQEELHDYVEWLSAKYLDDKRPRLTVIQGGRDDAR